MNIWGEKFKVSIFGESHGKGIGVIIDGIPSGTELDIEEIEREMKRRAPGKNLLSTQRKESDKVEILSGFFNGKTTGTPLAGVIYNSDMKSKDYTPELIRPGHADFTGFEKYGDSHDYRGGGHFSGRITAPLVFAGAIAKQVLKSYGITVGAHILKIGDAKDKPFDAVNLSGEVLEEVSAKEFPVCDDAMGEKMQKNILEKRGEADSIGGIIECGITGLKSGIGSPFFGSIESRISSMMFSIPAVKGIEFGAGYGFTDMCGSVANDEFYVENGEIKTHTNNNGGINGGISNGMPVIFNVAVKPTPSIGKKQRTVNTNTMENCELEIKGRHDPCIVHRAVCVAEAGTAIAILDMVLNKL
ncbi:MAG: chorismate synthase [Clostridia bacterium]|nr:chorismate synthase [Clostridia bacterium]